MKAPKLFAKFLIATGLLLITYSAIATQSPSIFLILGGFSTFWGIWMELKGGLTLGTRKWIPGHGIVNMMKTDAQTLEQMALEGWILHKVLFLGCFYLLRKEEPQELSYQVTLSYQGKQAFIDEKKQEGWILIQTILGGILIFKGTDTPFYDKIPSSMDESILGMWTAGLATLIYLILEVLLYIVWKLVQTTPAEPLAIIIFPIGFFFGWFLLLYGTTFLKLAFRSLKWLFLAWIDKQRK